MAVAKLSERPLGQRVRVYLEFAAAWSVFHVIRLLPFATVSALGGRLGRIIGPFLKSHNKRARLNMRRALPHLSPEQVEQYVAEMWENFGRSVFEFFVLDKIRVLEPNGPVKVEGLEHLEAAKGGGFLFGGHLGNWEFLPKTIFESGLQPVSVYREANNPLVETLIQRHRTSYMGSEMIPKGAEGARALLKAVRNKRVIGMLVDQKMNDGIPVPFFGRPAMTAPAIAQMALKSGLPVIGGQIIRTNGAQFRFVIEPPMYFETAGNLKQETAEAMVIINQMLERWITENPGQWFWMHNRWPKENESL